MDKKDFRIKLSDLIFDYFIKQHNRTESGKCAIDSKKLDIAIASLIITLTTTLQCKLELLDGVTDKSKLIDIMLRIIDESISGVIIKNETLAERLKKNIGEYKNGK